MFGFDEKFTANCRIYNMLKNAPKHLSFHTPGHKLGKWDITELTFSDNLSSPSGVLKDAQADIAKLLGAAASFILTDGSTSGVLSMIRAYGGKKLLFPVCSHKSVYNACKLMGIEAVTLKNSYLGSVPQQPTAEEIARAIEQNDCDGVMLTSPDYYGNIADYAAIKAVCLGHGIPLLCDGAHGAHLSGTEHYAGNYCDMWVDGVHKSLPCFTQGAVVSANEKYMAALAEAVDIFRTTSPNYMIMASVEYGVKYPVGYELFELSERLKRDLGAYPNADWTKIVLHYGANAEKVNDHLESQGIYPEFCDGENVMFYLSPKTSKREMARLRKTLLSLTALQTEDVAPMSEVKQGTKGKTVVWLPLGESIGKTCAANVGLFPPCVPLIMEGEPVTKEKIEKLTKGVSTFGLRDNKIAVYEDER